MDSSTDFSYSFTYRLILSPGTNPMPAATGNPEADPVGCVANYDAVSLRVCITSVVTFANVDLVASSIVVHLTSIQPLYDRNAKSARNNPTTTAAIFMTFFIAYPATAPNRNPPPAEKNSKALKNRSSTGNLEDVLSSHNP